MEIPKGNTLIEDIPMNYTDLEIMHRNLQEGSFTGYIQLRGSSGIGYIFMLHGGMIYALENVNNSYEATLELRLKNRAQIETLHVSTYVLSPSLVTILSQVFAYEPYSLSKKKISTCLKELEQDAQCGIMVITKNDENYYILLDDGKPVTDSILDSYGSIVCGSNTINQLTEESSRGIKVKFFGQRQGEIEVKKKQVERELSKIKILTVSVEKGLGLLLSDALKVDNILLDEWYQLEDPGKKINDIIVENERGNLTICKLQTKRNIGTGKVQVPSKLLKKLETGENQTLIIRPKAS